MATMLAHITILEGAEEKWEALIGELVEQTLANEDNVIRYEYWKGEAPRTWYGLLSFTDKEAFFVHQDADYHRDQPYGDCIEAMKLEFVDPVATASPLPHTENNPLPDDTPDNIREWEERTPVSVASWWQGRK